MESNQAIHELRKYGATLLAEEGVDLDAAHHPRTWFEWRPLNVALPALVLILFGNIGLAAAADSAVPGDLLYPVDRAYERIGEVFGIDTDTSSERLAEASVLLAEGRFDTAVQAIAASLADPSSQIGDRLLKTADELSYADTRALDREDLHRSIAELGSTVEALTVGGDNPVAWIEAIDASSQAVIDVAAGLPFEPAGQGDISVPPGQDEEFTPPGQEGGSPPPGQDEEFTPPGQDEEFTPPGQEGGSPPPGQRDKNKGNGK